MISSLFLSYFCLAFLRACGWLPRPPCLSHYRRYHHHRHRRPRHHRRRRRPSLLHLHFSDSCIFSGWAFCLYPLAFILVASYRERWIPWSCRSAIWMSLLAAAFHQTSPSSLPISWACGWRNQATNPEAPCRQSTTFSGAHPLCPLYPSRPI